MEASQLFVEKRLLGWSSPVPEFEAAQRIVETLKNHMLVMIAFPYVPHIVVILPIMQYISIKADYVWTLQYRSKPKRPWKAQKAGTVFSILYLCSIVVVGIPSAIFFLATKTFPKNCDIQDDNVGLCVSGLDAKNNCLTDPGSPYYYLYGGPTAERGTLASYPSQVLPLARSLT
jgi:hypothetical protein